MRVRTYYEKGTGEVREEVLLSRAEQSSRYDECLQAIYNNPGWYLDNLERLTEFKVNWKNYRERKNGKHSG